MSRHTDVLYISHGGGPLPLLGDPGHQALVTSLQGYVSRLRRPDAIVVVSAHWEAWVPTLTAAEQPELIYDYHGFPDAAYRIRYPAPGYPQLADQMRQQLQSAGIKAELDQQRGFDHGVFVPLKIMYPAADIPCVQLSLVSSLSAEQHLAMGAALRNLPVANLLVIGSGFSFHNMRAFFNGDTPQVETMNQAFEDWLRDTCSNPALTEVERWQRLAHWEQAPHARFCHPREEHLLPLQVCYGLAGKACDQHESIEVLNRQAGMFYWALEGQSD
ncbi:MAG: dioxygenase [Pseudomonadaceae bacterium]|nr:MAG: dioxygenase [Pseudomonadaceae bacterium]